MLDLERDISGYMIKWEGTSLKAKRAQDQNWGDENM